ncbi:hypothetical protein LRP88_07422 [Fusarium phalaenopsidis]
MSSILSAGLQGKLRDIIDEYTSGGTDRKIPGLVYLAFRNDGQPIFQHCSGTRGMSSQDLMSTDTIFYLASFTKVATSAACMQLVERGLLHLDNADEVERICPELRDVKVLTRTANGGFELVEKKKKITLRMLLNHTAGFGYAFEDDKLAEYTRPVGADDFSGEAVEIANRPLVNQPGEKFQYGISMDWVGVMIERVSGKSLDEYFKTNIFQPLGLISLLLNDGIDKVTGVRLLKPETVQDMFTDQISDKPRFSNVCVPVAKPELANPTPLTPMPDDHTEGWGMSFSISHFPSETGRAPGTASWEGLANLFWFADRKNNIGGIIASQIIPYGDRLVLECSDRVETEIYKALQQVDGS